MNRSNQKGPTQRQLRVGEQMRHVVAEILQRGELHDSRLDNISLIVSEVRVSPDLRHATAFTSELGRTLQPSTAEVLARHSAQLGARLARELHLKYAPRVIFVADQSFAEASRIETLIDQERQALSARAEQPAQEGSSDG